MQKHSCRDSAFRILHPAVAASVCVLQVALLSGCAGYQIGNRPLYRPDIRTVHVPVVQSESYRRYLGERLTEAIVKEIELRTPYKVVDEASADSVLSRTKGLPTKSGANCRPTICWRPSGITLQSFTTPRMMFE